MNKIGLLILVAFCFSACEKDDICDSNTPTTPRLVIDFYDTNNRASLRNVTNLKVIGAGMEDGLLLTETDIIGPSSYLSNGSSIAIPLKTLEDNTEYRFIFNFGAATERTDTIDFNYSRRDEYVSRACGFKTLFVLNSTLNPILPIVVNNNPASEDYNWIDEIEIVQSNINTENEAHVKIYF